VSDAQHLDAQTLAALLENPAAHSTLLAHLAEPCDVCEAFLAAHGGPGLLDGLTDAALLAQAPSAEASLDEVGFQKLKRAMKPSTRRPRWAYAAAAGLVAAAVMLFVRAPEGSPRDSGIKGSGTETVELQTVWQSPDGGLETLGPGAEVPAHGALLFRVRSPRRGRALLLVQRGDAEPQLVHAAEVSAGLEDLRSSAGALGFSLDGESGPVRMWLVVGDLPTGPSLESARAAVHSVGDGLAVGRFELHVKP
jgi:hypothetical protein